MGTISPTESSEMQGFNDAHRICKKILNSSILSMRRKTVLPCCTS